MVRRWSVVVAGGGVGGLAAAAGMAARGIDVTVVERAGQIGAGGSGLMIQPNGMRAADALGERIGARIRAVGHVTRPGEVRVLMDAEGTVLAEEPLGAAAGTPGDPPIPMLRSALHRALLDEALTAGAAVRLATPVESYTVRPGHVAVELSDGTTVDCDALVGADGIHSAVRARMLGDGPPQYRGYTSVRGRTTGSVLGQRGHVVNGRGIQLFIAPVGGDTLYWTAKITAPEGVWPAMGAAGARHALLAALEGWYPPVVDLVRDADPEDVVVTDIHDRDPSPRWVDGRVALLGDAAHPMVPALGQGANMALEDAAVLADALCSHTEIPAALAAYARERVDRAAAVVLASRRQGALDQGADRAGEERRNARMRSAGRKDAELADVLAWRPGPRRQQATAPAPPSTVRTAGEDSTMGAPRIVVISGSLRAGSTSDRVAAWCAHRCAEQGASARVFTGAEIDFPAYRPGLAGTHAAVADFLGALRRADGVILVSPTYHSTVSGLLKNALDYVNDIEGPVPYLEGRAIGTVAVGSAVQGAVSTLATLRTIGHALRGWPTPVGVAVAQAPEEPVPGAVEAAPDAARLVEMVGQVVWLGRARGAVLPEALGAVA
ncbi:NAD(P)H-dependent oxidoreductase [Streptomyces tirandamycinicus]|uniref:NAD(P)H-dependent oxidoreductase n=1 Tax=Streptomyces tirandamycinicus TaxID=2174846 RepID=UPI0022717322|nr:NAD(P)H-dependent oxidoreductase [Streptomyces tirandamycinicus]MCY0983649.1 NAD(P)H-dependent oxidoreductase [Streptomyces tirandamycinicus]